MIGRHEQYPSPSITGRGSHRHDQQFIISERKRSYRRRNLWSRGTQQSLVRANGIQLQTHCLRQGFRGNKHSPKNNRSAFTNNSQQFCNDGSVCQITNCGCRITRSRNQFATNRYAGARIFISLRWAARHANGYQLWGICSTQS